MLRVLKSTYSRTLWHLMLCLLPMSSTGNQTELFISEPTSGNKYPAGITDGTERNCYGKVLCINKCCPRNKTNEDCVVSGEGFNITVWKDGVEKIFPLPDNCGVVPETKCPVGQYKVSTRNGKIGLDLNDMKMKFKKPHRLHMWEELAVNTYCVDDQGPEKEFTCMFPDPPDFCPAAITIKVCGMLLSAVLLGLSTAIYLFMPSLQNLAGFTLVPYLISLMVAFLCIASLQLINPLPRDNETLCFRTSLVAYFCILSSFFWLNVKSFDLYRKFSGSMKIRNSFGRATLKFPYRKFYKCCAWGYGLPLALTILLATIDSHEDRMPEHIITPKIRYTCFLAGNEKFIWMDMPISALCLANVVLFVITWRAINRDRIREDSRRLINDRLNQRKLFLELALLTGVHWLLEVGSAMLPSPIWLLPDLVNSFIGVPIFYVVICKKKVKQIVRARLSTLNTSTSSSTRTAPALINVA